MTKEPKINMLMERDENLSRYFVEIAKFKKLTREEEHELFVRYKEGESYLKEKIIKHNLRFVVNIAKSYQQRNSKIKLMDLISAGNIGLTVAVDKFNNESGNKFITFAVWWIKNHIYQSFDKYKDTVKVPLNLQRKQKEVRKFINEYYADFGEEPNKLIISQSLNIDISLVDTYMTTMVVESIDAELDSNNSGDADTFQKDYKELTVYDNLKDDENHLIYVFNKILPILNHREREIVEYFYGLNNKDALTYSQIAEKMLIGEETVRQVKTLALRKLKYNFKSNKTFTELLG